MGKKKAPKLREDAAETAFRVLQEGKGGKKGGPARAVALSERQLKHAARKAAKKRWSDEKSA